MVFRVGLDALGREYPASGYHVVPLVAAHLDPRCNIEILLLRPEEDRLTFERGDLDGQVKTVIDALRMPTGPSQTGGATPDPDEDPFFCLLEDDKLVSEIKITADQLLMLPEQYIDNTRSGEVVDRLNTLLADQHLSEEDKGAIKLAQKALKRRGEVRANDAFIVVRVNLTHRQARTFDNYLG
jgi:hypothetical protein